VLSLVAVAAVSLLAANWAGAQGKATPLPRKQTLITTGTAWGAESNFNPFGGGWATGMVGLVNETLLRYDPLKDKYIPWLATKAGFQGKQYVIQLRKRVRFSNGKKLTPRMVVQDINLGKFKAAYWHVLWTKVKQMKVKGSTITVFFKGTPSYIQWQNLIWNLPIVYYPQFSGISETTFTSLGSTVGWAPIGTGPYTLDQAAYDPMTGVVWQERPAKSWWAAAQKVEPSPAPMYIEDLVPHRCWDLCPFTDGYEDLNNNYLPGIQNLVKKGQAQTYFKGSPYDLPANTAWLEVNTTKKALSDPQFRKALAEAVNTSKITGSGDYNGITTVANQTGLLKVWKKWINNSLVKKYGFKQSSTSAAKATLKAAGYKVGSNGFVNNKDGSKLKLNIEVPSGWSDWEAARSIIVSGERAAGIDVNVVTGSQGQVQTTDRNQGKFDLEVDNAYQLSDNPWTYFNGIFHLPIITSGSGQTFANFGRYGNAKAWAMVKKLDQTPPTNVKGRKAILSALEKIELTQIPIIPLWYNGIWSQTQSKYWKNWPSSTSKRNYIPTMWNGYLQMTGIDMITHLKRA
jgi:peptide/nickel transport system substrate-binding protein